MSLTPKEPSERNWKKGIEARLRRLETRRILGNAAISVGRLMLKDGGDIVLDGGDVLSSNFVPGSTGFRIDGSTGTPEFNDLILRGGIIGDDALENPIALQLVDAYKSSGEFPIGSGSAPWVTQTITRPAGYTRAFVTVSGSATLNGAAATTNLLSYIYSEAGAEQSATYAQTVPGSQIGNVAPSFAQAITDVPSSFDLRMYAFVSGSVSGALCYAGMSGLVYFLR